MEFFSNLLSALPGAAAQGLIWGLMAIGVFITFRVLDLADLTVDGTMATGGAVCIMLMTSGVNVWVALLCAFIAGMLAGLITGILHTFMGIPAILAGILTQLALFSINLRIMDKKANMAINPNNYDLLVRHNVYIVAEIQIPVRHALLGLPKAVLSDIRRVYSHPQALMQSSKYLKANREWQLISAENTAWAAKKIWEDGDITQAAVASETAGRLYGLKTLACPINYDINNTTRFIVLSKYPVYRRDAGKVSICFECSHKSGALYNMLGNLIYNHINMLMIESRPIEGRSWEYRFFVDMEGSLGDAGMQNALAGIRAEAAALRILGNY